MPYSARVRARASRPLLDAIMNRWRANAIPREYAWTMRGPARGACTVLDVVTHSSRDGPNRCNRMWVRVKEYG